MVNRNGEVVDLTKLKILIGIVLIVVVLFNLPFTYVPVGKRGILMRLGTPTGTVLSEGVSFKFPLVESIKLTEVRIQKEEADVSAASKDLQTVSSKVAVNYSVDPGKVVDLYRSLGDEYKVRVIVPAIQEAVKSVTARYTAEELITKRAEVSNTILGELKTRLGGYGILVTDLNIVDFDFSKSFNDAIEMKVTAEQNALASKNKLEQYKYEAEQAVVTAKGKAEAQKIEGEALRANPEVLQLRAIEKWEGQVPQYWGGGALPFINIK